MIHELKILPGYFEAVKDERKTFELRKNDRDFKVGDTLILKEWNIGEIDSTGPERVVIQEQGYTGREIKANVSYVLKGGKFGLHKNYAILGIKVIKDEAIGMETRETLIDFIVDSVNHLEGPLSPEDNLDLVNKLNNMTRLELEKEADFYDEALWK